MQYDRRGGDDGRTYARPDGLPFDWREEELDRERVVLRTAGRGRARTRGWASRIATIRYACGLKASPMCVPVTSKSSSSRPVMQQCQSTMPSVRE